MTRAPRGRPLKRLVDGGDLGQLVVEIRDDTITLRPYRGRAPLVTATYGTVVRSVLLRIRPPRRRRRVSRGLLATEASP